ncbi:polysaccharide deacetylase family protein [Nitrospinae bacterium AH_259_B05_G02_I21]|nr:polysaccharide deacetylase family protein [Nitrospinae bacterium AH_259_B05_G02_I21]MDA2931919.1 polysaccharide deacetylase family protein [Nitrospinae bacterium AH-259-F20]
MSPEVFEEQMRYLAEKGYYTLHISELIRFLYGRRPPPSPSVVITFDDGYLDNWVYAYPILKKYGLKAALCLITERVEAGEGETRPNLYDVWEGRVTLDQLPSIPTHEVANARAYSGGRFGGGHVNWSEVKQMVKSGLIDIYSHTHTHSPCFYDETITGFLLDSTPPWEAVASTRGDLRSGLPLHPWRSALVARRYIDDERLVERLVEFATNSCPGTSTEVQAELESKLWRIVEEYRKEHGQAGFYEDHEVYLRRVVEELVRSKALLEEYLDRPCKYICWPFGEHSSLLISLAQQLGYKGAITNDCGVNVRGSDPFLLRRVPAPGDFEAFKRTVKTYSSGLRERVQRVRTAAFNSRPGYYSPADASPS